MDWFDLLSHEYSSPLLTAFCLGLLINISPCPLCTNITAIGFLGKDVGNRKKVLRNSALYMLGKTIAYTALAVMLFFVSDLLRVRIFFETYGEKILGPVLLIAGIVLLDIIPFHKHDENCHHKYFLPAKSYSLGAFWLGVLFALAFCPYSGVVYFGILIPMSVTSPRGLLLPVVFSVATVLPVLVISWLLAFGVSSIAKIQNKLNVFDFWSRKISAILFILIGLYTCIEQFL